jgi:hypothetical protein
MGIEEGEEMQAKGMCNIFNKIIPEIKSRENYAHSDPGSLQNTKQM